MPFPPLNPALKKTAQGLYKKYTVIRNDGQGQSGAAHENDEYFVLNLTTDPFAKPALEAYAKACRDKFPKLASDLEKLCENLK